MRSITRRELSRNCATILNQILATGEPVEVTTQGRDSLIITPKPRTDVYEQWVAQGLVLPGNGRSLADLPGGDSTRPLAEILADEESDH